MLPDRNAAAGMLRSLKLENLLSFGAPGVHVPLGPLNVLIGPNGSGKSNFIEAIGLLKAAAGDLFAPVRAGGGALEWVWKGAGGDCSVIEAVVEHPRWVLTRGQPAQALPPLRHKLWLELVNREREIEVAEERIEDAAVPTGKRTPSLYYGKEAGSSVLRPTGARRPDV